MSNDVPIHECESDIDHYTGYYVPYSLRRVSGFFNVPQVFFIIITCARACETGPTVYRPYPEKTRKSNRLQMTAALSPQLFKIHHTTAESCFRCDRLSLVLFACLKRETSKNPQLSSKILKVVLCCTR